MTPNRHRARLEMLERRELLAADLSVNHAPAGADRTVATMEAETYTFSVADFGFSDPADAVSPPLFNVPAANKVLVLYNPASSAGVTIANYYAQVHPGANLLAIDGLDPNTEEITDTTYLNVIRPQVLAGLTDSIDYIVTTKGMPLRINVTATPPTAVFPILPTYLDPQGILRSISAWKTYSSLESELASIDRISVSLMMGDQSYNLPNTFTANPYFLSNVPFSHAAFTTRLTARLDGYSVTDVLAAIDRAQQARIGPANNPSGPFYFVVDNDPAKSYAPSMARLVNNVVTPAGLPLVYDNTSAFVGTAPGPVIAYDGHGSRQYSTPWHYLTSSVQFSLADGAVFESWESYNAFSFNPAVTTHSNQGQIGEWLQIGGTAGVGTVEEPGASTSSLTNEDQMFKMLLAGRTFAEAAWSGTLQLSWVNTFVGDPLMVWQPLPNTPDNLAAVRIASLPAAGTLTLAGVPLVVGQFVSITDIAAGALRFVTPYSGSGLGLANFTFQVQDTGGTDSGGVDLDPTPNTITIDVDYVHPIVVVAPLGSVEKGIMLMAERLSAFFSSDFGWRGDIADLQRAIDAIAGQTASMTPPRSAPDPLGQFTGSTSSRRFRLSSFRGAELSPGGRLQ